MLLYFKIQNSKLFKTTIYENVKIGNPKATDEEIIKALKDARCDDTLDKFIDLAGAYLLLIYKNVVNSIDLYKLMGIL